ncbi:MAG: 2-dehydropantoate 2-reductase [Spirochaetales bacterium]|jgi:2-dehydropantoate 2-reductase|nr:2-dehydropantoate 2-reductase [Spirochaetales bacterium]
MKTVIIGAGALGGCMCGWLSKTHQDVYLLDQGEVARNLKEKGLALYHQGKEDKKEHIPVKVIDSLSDVDDVDIIAIAVKNYSLDAVAKSVKEQAKGSPIIVGLQNGIENQSILPQYFDRIVYSIIEFNAWIDEPGVIGYQNKGPFVIGTAGNELQDELKAIRDYMNPAVQTVVTDRIRDAAYCKMVINLTNSFTTLVGFKYRDISSMPLFKKILTNSMYEGVKIVKAAGVSEYRADNMPSWGKIKAAATLPDFIMMGIFKKNLDKMVLSSMAQDILQRRTGVSELDSLIGRFVALADKYNIPAPYNRTIYALCKSEFAKPDFKPLTEEQIWQAIQKNL